MFEKLAAAGMGVLIFFHTYMVGLPLAFAITYTLSYTDTMGDADITHCIVKKDGANWEKTPYMYDDADFTLEALYKRDPTKWQTAFDEKLKGLDYEDVSVNWKNQMLFGLIINWILFAMAAANAIGQFANVPSLQALAQCSCCAVIAMFVQAGMALGARTSAAGTTCAGGNLANSATSATASKYYKAADAQFLLVTPILQIVLNTVGSCVVVGIMFCCIGAAAASEF